MIDVLIGACWTLICILVGGLITLVLLAVLGDRPLPNIPPDDEPPDDPEPTYPYTDEEMDRWIREHTTTEFFEADLLEQR